MAIVGAVVSSVVSESAADSPPRRPSSRFEDAPTNRGLDRACGDVMADANEKQKVTARSSRLVERLGMMLGPSGDQHQKELSALECGHQRMSDFAATKTCFGVFALLPCKKARDLAIAIRAKTERWWSLSAAVSLAHAFLIT